MPRVLAVDPGTTKAGYALLDGEGLVEAQGIEPIEALPQRLADVLAARPVEVLALGAGTRDAQLLDRLRRLGPPVRLVDERDTSRFARALYFADHPPRGWRRLVPLGLQVPPRPIDDYAAILIGRRYLGLSAVGSVPSPERRQPPGRE